VIQDARINELSPQDFERIKTELLPKVRRYGYAFTIVKDVLCASADC